MGTLQPPAVSGWDVVSYKWLILHLFKVKMISRYFWAILLYLLEEVHLISLLVLRCQEIASLSVFEMGKEMSDKFAEMLYLLSENAKFVKEDLL